MELLNDDMYGEVLKYVPQIQLPILRLVSKKFKVNVDIFIKNGIYVIETYEDMKYAIDNDMIISIINLLESDKMRESDLSGSFQYAYKKRKYSIIKIMRKYGLNICEYFLEENIVLDLKLITCAYPVLLCKCNWKEIITKVCKETKDIEYFNILFPKLCNFYDDKYKSIYGEKYVYDKIFDDKYIFAWLDISYENRRYDIFKNVYDQWFGEYFDCVSNDNRNFNLEKIVGKFFMEYIGNAVKNDDVKLVKILLHRYILLNRHYLDNIYVNEIEFNNPEIKKLVCDFFRIRRGKNIEV